MKIANLEHVSFYTTSVPERIDNEYALEKVGILYGPQRGQQYLFSGRVEVLKDKKGSIRLCIWKTTGEFVGFVRYGTVLFSDGRECTDLSSGISFKTVHYLDEERFFIYVDYEEIDGIPIYVMFRMDLCPGDEDILNELVGIQNDYIYTGNQVNI